MEVISIAALLLLVLIEKNNHQKKMALSIFEKVIKKEIQFLNLFQLLKKYFNRVNGKRCKICVK